jgi:phenylacetate-CoA ligase
MYEHLPWYRSPRYSKELEAHLCRSTRQSVEDIQSTRFKRVVEFAWDNIPFYRWLWDQAGVHPESIRSISDIQKLPTWNKDTQRQAIEQHPPFGNYYTFSHLSDASLIVSTSGTTGLPVMMPIKADDLPGLQDTWARTMGYIGVNSTDIVQDVFTLSTMGGAWCGMGGAFGVDATVLPTSSGKTTSSIKQLQWIKQAGTTVMYGTASYFSYLGRLAIDEGYDLPGSTVRLLITAGEMVSEATSREIETLWGAQHYDLYGTVDTMTWTGVTCDESRKVGGRTGMHVWEDFGLVEVLDPTGKRMSDGEYGNMTVTSWAWKNSPRIRFSTGDRAAVDSSPCACGSCLMRMLPIQGRVDDMIRIKGQNIFPMAIENVLKSLTHTVSEYIVEVSSAGSIDQISLMVEASGSDGLDQEIVKRFSSTFNVTPSVKIVPIGSTADMTGAGKETKVKRIFDKRPKVKV